MEIKDIVPLFVAVVGSLVGLVGVLVASIYSSDKKQTDEIRRHIEELFRATGGHGRDIAEIKVRCKIYHDEGD